MVAVGERAGVSRQSVYNEFGSRSGLAEALIQRETGVFLAAVAQAFSHAANPVAGITAASQAVLELGEQNELLAAAVSVEPGTSSELLQLLTSQSQPIIDAATALVGDWLGAQLADSPSTPDSPEATAGVVVRLVLSFLIRPQGSPEQMADAVGAAAAGMLRQ